MLYCNGGYHLLTHVIERISGQRFERFLAERIFEPLGMHDTESVPSDFDIKPGMATLYQALPTGAAGSDAEWRRGIFPVEDIGGEGAIVSTVDDMLRWIAHLRGSDKRVGSAASWAQMTAPTVLVDGAVTSYGLGLMRHSYRGVEVVRHGGTVIGGTCQMLTVPAHALDISIMTNGAKTSPRALAWKIVDALLAAHLGPPPAHVPSAERPALMGQPYYSPATGVLVRFGDAEGRLGLSWLGSPPMPLRSELGRLSLASEDSMMAPISIKTTGLDGDVAPAFITLTVGGSVHRFALMNTPAPSAADLAPQLEGRYRVPDMDATACIARTGDTLRLHVQGPYGRRTLRLQPLSTDLFMIASDGQPSSTPTVGVIRIDRDADRVLGLRLEEGRTRGLRFIREYPDA
ncbi:D-aminopeptidase [compost metagenome]